MYNCSPFSLLYNIPLCKNTLFVPLSKGIGLVPRFWIRNNDVGNIHTLGFWRIPVRVCQERQLGWNCWDPMLYECSIWQDGTKYFQNSATTSSVWWFQSLCIVVCTYYHHVFFFKWTWWLCNELYFTLSFPHISLMTNELENLFIYAPFKSPNLARG